MEVPPVSRKRKGANLVAGFVLDPDLPLAVVPERAAQVLQLLPLRASSPSAQRHEAALNVSYRPSSRTGEEPTIDQGAGPCRSKAMARHRIHSLSFKKQIVQEYAAGATLNGLARERPLAHPDPHLGRQVRERRKGRTPRAMSGTHRGPITRTCTPSDAVQFHNRRSPRARPGRIKGNGCGRDRPCGLPASSRPKE